MKASKRYTPANVLLPKVRPSISRLMVKNLPPTPAPSWPRKVKIEIITAETATERLAKLQSFSDRSSERKNARKKIYVKNRTPVPRKMSDHSDLSGKTPVNTAR